MRRTRRPVGLGSRLLGTTLTRDILPTLLAPSALVEGEASHDAGLRWVGTLGFVSRRDTESATPPLSLSSIDSGIPDLFSDGIHSGRVDGNTVERPSGPPDTVSLHRAARPPRLVSQTGCACVNVLMTALYPYPAHSRWSFAEGGVLATVGTDKQRIVYVGRSRR